MQPSPNSAPPRLFVAVLWIASMFISWAGGALLIGFDLGTSLIWLALTILGPLVVWGFVAAAQAGERSRSLAEGQPPPRRLGA